MRLAMAQMSMTRSVEKNLEKGYRLAAAARGADLLFYPELQHAPFLPQYHAAELEDTIGARAEDYLLKEDAACIKEFQRLAQKYRLALSPNLYLAAGAGRYDTSLFIDRDGRLLGRSAMVHILSAPAFYETEYYTPSRDGFPVYETSVGRIGIVICFDRHLPESIRTCALRGAQLVLVPTANLTSEPMELFAQEIRVQAYQNGVFVAMCNRVGREGAVTFAGESLVAAPSGELLCRADGAEGLYTCELDLGAAERAQRERPYLRLRRPEMYA